MAVLWFTGSWVEKSFPASCLLNYSEDAPNSRWSVVSTYQFKAIPRYEENKNWAEVSTWGVTSRYIQPSCGHAQTWRHVWHRWYLLSCIALRLWEFQFISQMNFLSIFLNRITQHLAFQSVKQQHTCAAAAWNASWIQNECLHGLREAQGIVYYQLSQLLSIMYNYPTTDSAAFAPFRSFSSFILSVGALTGESPLWINTRCLIPAGCKPHNGFGKEVSDVELGENKANPTRSKFVNYCCISEKTKRLCSASPKQPVQTCQLKRSTSPVMQTNCALLVLRIPKLLLSHTSSRTPHEVNSSKHLPIKRFGVTHSVNIKWMFTARAPSFLKTLQIISHMFC